MAGNQKTYSLLFKLQAELGNYSSSFKSAIDTTQKLQNSITKINSLQGKVDGYKKQSAGLDDNKKKLSKLNTEQERLQKELKQTAAPSEQLQRKMELNARQIEKTTAKIKEQETQLNALGKELHEAGVDTEHLSEENNRLSQSYDKVKKNQENLAKIAKLQEKNAAEISKTKKQLAGTIGVIAAVGTALYAGPVKQSINFEKAMAQVGTIADETILPLSKMKKEIMQLSNEMGVGASTVAEDVYNAISAGQSTGDAVNFVRQATMLAKGGFAETGQALDVLTTILNAYGMKSSEAERVSNILIQTQNKGKVTVAQLSSVMGKIIPTAKANNVALEQVAAGYAIMTSKGIAAAETTTYMNSMLNELGKTGSASDKALRQVTKKGFKDLMKSGKSMAEVLEILQSSAKKSGKSLADMFGSAEAGKAALTLMDGGVKGFNASVSGMVNSTGAAQAAFAKMAATTENKLAKAKAALGNLSIVLGDTFLPYVTSGAEKLSELVGQFSAWAQKNPELLRTIVKVAAGIAALKVGALGAKLGFLQIKGGILTLMNAFQKLQALGGIKGIFNGLGGIKGIFSGLGKKMLPLVGIATGIGLAIKLISGHLQDVRGWIQKTFGDTGLAIFDKVWGVIQNVGNAIRGVFSGGNMSGVKNFFANAFGDAGISIFNSLVGILNSLKGIFPGIITQLAKMAEGVLPLLMDFLGQLAPVLMSVVVMILPVIINLISQLLPIIMQIVQSVLPIILQLIKTLAPVITQIIQAVLPVVIKLLQQLLPIILQIALTVLPIIINLFNTLAPIITQLIKSVLPILQQLLQAIAPIIKIVADVFSAVVSALRPLVEALLPILQKILQALMPIIQVLATLFGNVLGTALKGISGIIGGVTKILQGLIDFVTGVFTGNWSKAWEGVKKIFSGIVSGLAAIFKVPINLIIDGINFFLGNLNKLKIPDWVPGVGGKGFNIKMIPKLAKGSNFTPDTFIAGEAGPELITNAAGRKVFTAAQTGDIFGNLNAAKQEASSNNIKQIVMLAPQLLAAATRTPAMAGVSVNAQSTAPPAVTAGTNQRTTVLEMHSSTVINTNGGDTKEIEEQLQKRDEDLLQRMDERLRAQEDKRRREVYD